METCPHNLQDKRRRSVKSKNAKKKFDNLSFNWT